MREFCHRKESLEKQCKEKKTFLSFLTDFKVSDTSSSACLASSGLGMIAEWSIEILHSLSSLVVKPIHQQLQNLGQLTSLSLSLLRCLASNVSFTQMQSSGVFPKEQKQKSKKKKKKPLHLSRV